jgi:looped-hinge helix DNA binding domain, AbrB family
MRSTITSRGQAVIPSAVRKRFSLGPADRLGWIVEDDRIVVVSVKADPVAAFRGRGRGASTERVVEDRRRDAEAVRIPRLTHLCSTLRRG